MRSWCYAAGVTETDSPSRRLARVVQELIRSSYTHAKQQVEVGHVTVNGEVVCDPGALVADTDVIEHRPGLPRRRRVPQLPELEVLHLDASVMVVVKPSGVLAHRTRAGEADTLVARALADLGRRGVRKARVQIVHRIDRDTSGVVVLARTHEAAEHLNAQFHAHTVERRYLAVVSGPYAGGRAVDTPIGRPRPGARRTTVAAAAGGQAAHTDVEAVATTTAAALVRATLHTGRTHQVRVHLASIGHPVLGDALYGGPAEVGGVAVPRLALHAEVLGFTHPATGAAVRFEAPLPHDLAELVRRLGLSDAAAAQRGDPPRRGTAAATPPPPRHTPPRPGEGRAPDRPGGREDRSPRKPRRRR